MSPANDRGLLALAVSLAEQAGAAILGVRAKGFAVQHKADHTPVTEADHLAEQIIAKGLRSAVPEIPVIAEEEIAAGQIRESAQAFWLVDPLDGTREFASGKDEFAVNIGLVRDGRMALGVVAIPAIGELFAGVPGQGAWKRSAAGQITISVRKPPAEGLTVVASRHHGDLDKLNAYLDGRQVARTLGFGSSLKFCRIAEGVADLYPRFGRTMEWDTGAPQAIVEAAGGRVLTLDRTPLRYGKPGWENPHFICAGALGP